MAAELGATVRLAPHTAGWGIEVALPPPPAADSWRGAAFLFNDIDELDLHARLLGEWIASVR